MNESKNNHAAFSLSEAELMELLRRMDNGAQNRAARDRRKHVRHALVSRNVSMTVLQPGGGSSERCVTLRDLSAGGVSVLYPGYLHTGSLAQLELRKRMGGTETVHGTIRNCRLIHGVWHAVGIKFKEVIFPQLFLSQPVQDEFEGAASQRIDISRLKGSLLLIDDQPMDRNLFMHLLKGSSLRVSEASTPDEAMALVTRSMTAEQSGGAQAADPFDLIVCDLNLGAVTGETLMAQIREKGYRGPMLVMTAETMPDRINGALAAGGTAVLQKPYSPEKLHSSIANQLGDRCIEVDDPLFSPLSADAQGQLIVEKYVSDVRATASELRKWIKEDNLSHVRVLCQSLKGTGAGYGFALLTDVATATLTSLDASYSIEESITELHRLDAVCSRLTSAPPPVLPKPRR